MFLEVMERYHLRRSIPSVPLTLNAGADNLW